MRRGDKGMNGREDNKLNDFWLKFIIVRILIK